MILEIIGSALLIFGTVFIFLSAIGIIKLPDLYMRMSATTKSATIGVGSVLASSAIFFSSNLGIPARSLAIILFLLLTAPVAAHMIGRAAYINGAPLWKKTLINELEGRYDEEHVLRSKDVKGGKKED